MPKLYQAKEPQINTATLDDGSSPSFLVGAYFDANYTAG